MTKIAFDTETRGLAWWDTNEQAFLASWADARNEYAIPLLTKRDRDKFNKQTLRKAKTIVAHNLKFDTHQTRETTGYDVMANGHVLHDTDLLSRVLHPEGARKGDRGGHGLKNLAASYLTADALAAEDAIKEMGKQIGLRTLKQTGAYYEVWRAYPEIMEHYARMDARYTYDLHDIFERELAKDGRAQRIYALECKVLPILTTAEVTGVALDHEVVDSLWDEWSGKQEALYASVSAELGEEALGGPGSEDALREALLKAGVPLHRKTDTGILSTDKFALQEFEDEHEVVGQLMELRTAERFLGTYIGPMRERDVVHCSFNQCGAWTGRMSCRSPNMQNIPKRAGKEVRAMFVPREGHAFVVSDFESIEVRLLAYYLGDQGFRQMIEEGHDPHAWMASNIHGGTPDMYAKGTDGQRERDIAKHTLFAIVYGAGAPRVSDMNKISRDQAKALISTIKSSLPNYKRLNRRIRNKIENVGHVNTAFGRKQVVNPEKSYVGLNALIQGTAADVMKQAAVNVTEATEDLGAKIILLVHDELVQEVPIDAAQETLRRTEEAMVEAAFEGMAPRLSVESSIVTTNYADA